MSLPALGPSTDHPRLPRTWMTRRVQAAPSSSLDGRRSQNQIGQAAQFGSPPGAGPRSGTESDPSPGPSRPHGSWLMQIFRGRRRVAQQGQGWWIMDLHSLHVCYMYVGLLLSIKRPGAELGAIAKRCRAPERSSFTEETSPGIPLRLRVTRCSSTGDSCKAHKTARQSKRRRFRRASESQGRAILQQKSRTEDRHRHLEK